MGQAKKASSDAAVRGAVNVLRTKTLGVSCHQAPVRWIAPSSETSQPVGTTRLSGAKRKWEAVSMSPGVKPPAANWSRIQAG